MIEDKIIHPRPAKIMAVAEPQLPLAVKAGQTFAVQLEEAVSGPSFLRLNDLKANPELSSAVQHPRSPLYLDAAHGVYATSPAWSAT